MLFQRVPGDCSKDELKQLVLRSMAFETIFAKENLGYSEEEFQQEYEDAKREFEESKSEFDDARLREQVAENLKVSLFALVMTAFRTLILATSMYLIAQQVCIFSLTKHACYVKRLLSTFDLLAA